MKIRNKPLSYRVAHPYAFSVAYLGLPLPKRFTGILKHLPNNNNSYPIIKLAKNRKRGGLSSCSFQDI